MISDSYAEILCEQLKKRLGTRYMGHIVKGYDYTDSTNTEANAWAERGAPEGALVMAEYQTQGRGRQGRSWHSSESRNLLFSIVLRPTLPPTHLALITVVASLAVTESIRSLVSPTPVQIKWPNDILLNGKKCCGMLLETSYSPNAPSTSSQVIMGIGINVNQDQFTPELETRSTSILLEIGRHTDRIGLLVEILGRFESYYEALQNGAREEFIALYEKNLAYLNERITVRLSKDPSEREICLRGITDTGALQVETEDGLEILHAAEVTTNGVS